MWATLWPPPTPQLSGRLRQWHVCLVLWVSRQHGRESGCYKIRQQQQQPNISHLCTHTVARLLQFSTPQVKCHVFVPQDWAYPMRRDMQVLKSIPIVNMFFRLLRPMHPLPPMCVTKWCDTLFIAPLMQLAAQQLGTSDLLCIGVELMLPTFSLSCQRQVPPPPFSPTPSVQS